MLTRYISVRCVAFTLHFLFRYFSQGEMGEMACKDLPERQVSVDIFPTVHETKLGYHIWKKKTSIVVFMIITMTITTILVFSVTSSKKDQNKNQNHSTDKVQNLGNERR